MSELEFDFDVHNKKLWKYIGTCFGSIALLFFDFPGQITETVWREILFNVLLFVMAVINGGMGITRFVVFRNWHNEDDDPPPDRIEERPPVTRTVARVEPELETQLSEDDERKITINARQRGQIVSRLLLSREAAQIITDCRARGELERVTLGSLHGAGINRTNGGRESLAHKTLATLRDSGLIDEQGYWTDAGASAYPPHSPSFQYATV